MADFNYDAYESGFDDSHGGRYGLLDRARAWVNISGAVCSVALVAGLGLWGYQLAVRDVTGVPVMRAAAGAMRVAPADPGGAQALNQGLTVNAIAAMGTSANPADTITLAPMAVTLEPDDLPQAAAADQAAAQASVVDPSLAGQPLPATGETVSTAAIDTAVQSALTEVSATTADISAETDMAVIVPTDPNAMRVSPRPQPRPGRATTAAADLPAEVQTASASVRELDPASIAAGTRLAQLGAFETAEIARTQFAELQRNLGELLAGKDMVVQSAQSGGRTFYRLRAHGFANEEDARRFCAALQAEGTDCIPVTQK